jgi:hypothetical protein
VRARAVNRSGRRCARRGIVATSGGLRSQGDRLASRAARLPSQRFSWPRLSVKRMLREISATYRHLPTPALSSSRRTRAMFCWPGIAHPSAGRVDPRRGASGKRPARSGKLEAELQPRRTLGVAELSYRNNVVPETTGPALHRRGLYIRYQHWPPSLPDEFDEPDSPPRTQAGSDTLCNRSIS